MKNATTRSTTRQPKRSASRATKSAAKSVGSVADQARSTKMTHAARSSSKKNGIAGKLTPSMMAVGGISAAAGIVALVWSQRDKLMDLFQTSKDFLTEGFSHKTNEMAGSKDSAPFQDWDRPRAIEGDHPSYL